MFSGHKDEQHDYLLANNLPTLLWLGQVRHARVPRLALARQGRRRTPRASAPTTSSSLEALEASVLNYPDYLVFDIDPYIYSGKEAKGAEPELNKKGFASGRRVAFWLRDAAEGDVARGRGEDLRQDRPARVRADRAHGDLRRGARTSARWSAAT